ncbi:MAG: XdhC family protein [Chloroflexi bacterium]|nr:XdhC family protein [Chloroflexota bacterium]
MKALFEAAMDRARSGERVALATIVAVRGSTPRKPGAKMIVTPEGKILGTVGGGCGEAEVFYAAMQTIQDGQPRRVRVDLTEDIDLDLRGAICGGIMDVFVEPIGPDGVMSDE